MTQRSSRSCATSSLPLSPDAGGSGPSRRALLTYSAVWTSVLLAPASAHADTGRSSARRAIATDTTGATFNAAVTAREVQDVTAIVYDVTNLQATTENYSLSYVDDRTGRQSKVKVITVDPGQTETATLYGGLNRSFTAKVCPDTSPCVVVGPVSTDSP